MGNFLRQEVMPKTSRNGPQMVDINVRTTESMGTDEEGIRFRAEDEFISFTDRKVGRTTENSFRMRVW